MYIYFLSTGDAIKIAVLNSALTKLTDIKVSNPQDIILVHSFFCEDGKERQTEAKIHHLFQSIRLRGDWFKADPSLLGFIDYIKLNGWDSHGQWIKRHCS